MCVLMSVIQRRLCCVNGYKSDKISIQGFFLVPFFCATLVSRSVEKNGFSFHETFVDLVIAVYVNSEKRDNFPLRGDASKACQLKAFWREVIFICGRKNLEMCDLWSKTLNLSILMRNLTVCGDAKKTFQCCEWVLYLHY